MTIVPAAGPGLFSWPLAPQVFCGGKGEDHYCPFSYLTYNGNKMKIVASAVFDYFPYSKFTH